jgi:hypothetical protein
VQTNSTVVYDSNWAMEHLMAAVAVEVSDDEMQHFHNVAFEYKSMKLSNFDGEIINTVIVSLTSSATIAAVMAVILEIVKQRRSSSIKINGIEINNVSQKTVLEALKVAGTQKN